MKSIDEKRKTVRKAKGKKVKVEPKGIELKSKKWLK